MRGKQSLKNNSKPIAIFTVLFIVLVAVLMSVYILTAPDDIPKLQPDNTSGNLLSGAAVAGGENILYFCDNGMIYSIFAEKVEYLTDGNAPLFSTNGGVIYTNGTDIYQYISKNHAKELVLQNVSSPVVIGRWVYYLDNGEIIKQRLDDGKVYRLGLFTNGNYYISATSIYYLGNDGYLYSAKTDGSENRLMASYKMKDFIVGGNHIFYRSDGGVLCWFAAATPAAKVEYRSVDSYNYVSGHLVFISEGKLCTYDMSGSMKESVLLENIGDAKLYCDGEYIYLLSDGKVTRIAPDGSGEKIFTTEGGNE